MSKTFRSLKEATVLCAFCLLLLTWAIAAASPIVTLIVGLAEIAVLNYFVGKRDVLYPAFVFSVIWALVSVAFFFCPIPIDPLHWKTILIFLGGDAALSAGVLAGNRSITGKEIVHPPATDHPQARNVLLALTVGLTSVFLIIIVHTAGSLFSLGVQALIALNAPDSRLADAGSASSTIIMSGGLLPVLTLWILLIENERRWKVAVCLVCALLFPLIVTQRGLVMVAFCGALTLMLLKKRDRSFRKMARPLGFAAIGIVGVMGAMSLTKYWVQEPGGISVTKGIWQYIAGPLAAFDHAVYHPGEYSDQPAAVFAQVLNPAARLGLVRYESWLQLDGSSLDRFVNVPFPANVYTAYKPYYEDFGLTGCLLAFALIGWIEGQLFYRAVRGGRFAMLFLAQLAGPLMFTTFDDLFHGFSRHLNVFIFAVLYFGLLSRFRVTLVGKMRHAVNEETQGQFEV